MDLDSTLNHELHAQVQYRLIEKLSESERRYRKLVESLREIVFNCDQTGHFTFLLEFGLIRLGTKERENSRQNLLS